MTSWLTRHITAIVSVAAGATILGIALTAVSEPNTSAALIAGRQMYGLTALGVLLAATTIGPLTAVLPRVPLRGMLLAGRRAIGVSAFVFAVAHMVCYIVPILPQAWHELTGHGLSWTIGLILGTVALIDLTVLAWTSRDASVKSLGGKRWKRLHRTVYAAIAVVLLHALLVGTDFGVNRPPDVQAEADIGSLIAFSIITVVWLVLAALRWRGVQWPARPTATPASPSSSEVR